MGHTSGITRDSQDAAVHAASLLMSCSCPQRTCWLAGPSLPQRSACDDVSFLSAMQALVATLTHDERLKDGQEVYLQFALLYTTTDGHRRIR